MFLRELFSFTFRAACANLNRTYQRREHARPKPHLRSRHRPAASPSIECQIVKNTLPAGPAAVLLVPDPRVPCPHSKMATLSGCALLNEFVSRLRCGCAPGGYVLASPPGFPVRPHPTWCGLCPAEASLQFRPSLEG